MVAHGEDVGTGIEEFGRDGGGESVAAGGVLAVDDHRVAGEGLAQPGQFGQEHGAPGAADDVADEEDAHGLSFPARRSAGSQPR